MQGSNTIQNRFLLFVIARMAKRARSMPVRQPNPPKCTENQVTRLRHSTDNFLIKTCMYFSILQQILLPLEKFPSAGSILVLQWLWIIKNTSLGKNSKKLPKSILRNLWQLSYMHTFSRKMCTFPVLVLHERCAQCSNMKLLKWRD